jgi:hypothetical protein
MLKKSPENRHNKELRLEKIRTSIDGTISTMQSIKRVDNS